MNIDAISFTRQFVKELDNAGLFNPNVDVFLDKEAVFDELYKVVTHNITEGRAPYPTDEQFDAALISARNTIIEETMDDMVGKGIFAMRIAEDGSFSYAPPGETCVN